mmetsp:Transcript_18879/g.40557  ORF Transcript_18879/g.40557 Transcript_18879/m.40557 type:complete len:360 (+) Transcript_18879:328-1407(+)
MLGQDGAVNAVLRVGRNCPDHVSRIDVLDGKRDLLLLEVVQDAVFHPNTNIFLLLWPVAAASETLAAAIGDHNDSVTLPLHDVLTVSQDLAHINVHLGDDAEIDNSRGHDRIQGHEAALLAQQLDHADAVRVASCFDIGRLDGFFRLANSRVKAEGLIHDGQIVVDGLRDADDRAFIVDFLHGIESLHGTLMGAIAAQDEVRPDALAGQGLGDLAVRRVASVAHKDGAALGVDALNSLSCEFNPSLWFDTALEASNDAIDFLDAIASERFYELSNDRVQTRADSSTCHDGSSEIWIGGVPMQCFSWATSQHLKGRAALVIINIPLLKALRSPSFIIQEEIWVEDGILHCCWYVSGGELR